MSAVACSRLFRPSLPVIGGRDVAHSFDTDGNRTPVTWNSRAGHAAPGGIATGGSGLGNAPTSREHRRGLYGCSLSCQRGRDFRRNFVTEAAIPSLVLERHAG